MFFAGEARGASFNIYIANSSAGTNNGIETGLLKGKTGKKKVKRKKK